MAAAVAGRHVNSLFTASFIAESTSRTDLISGRTGESSSLETPGAVHSFIHSFTQWAAPCWWRQWVTGAEWVSEAAAAVCCSCRSSKNRRRENEQQLKGSNCSSWPTGTYVSCSETCKFFVFFVFFFRKKHHKKQLLSLIPLKNYQICCSFFNDTFDHCHKFWPFHSFFPEPWTYTSLPMWQVYSQSFFVVEKDKPDWNVIWFHPLVQARLVVLVVGMISQILTNQEVLQQAHHHQSCCLLNSCKLYESSFWRWCVFILFLLLFFIKYAFQ